jgi:predicted TIM-barrel fold metal-dependent hydrolase
MIVDVHAHLFHPKWYPEAFSEGLVKDYVRRSRAAGRHPDLSQTAGLLWRMLSDETGNITLRIMDKLGIERKVILVIDWGLELGEASSSIEEINEQILGICARSGGRLLGFAGVDPRRPEAVELLNRACDSWGARGLKLHPTGGWRLSDERTHNLVALAVQRGLPVLVHVGRTIDILKDTNAQPQSLIELARAFPQGRFVAGHSGFESFEVFLRAPELPPNLYFDISGWQQWLQADRQAVCVRLSKLIRAFPSRVCFGSDAPFFTYNMVSAEKAWLSLLSDFLAGLPSTLREAAAGLLVGQDLFL